MILSFFGQNVTYYNNDYYCDYAVSNLRICLSNDIDDKNAKEILKQQTGRWIVSVWT